MLRRYAERNSEPTAISYVLIYQGGAGYYDLMHMDDGLESSTLMMILSFLGVLLPLILNWFLFVLKNRKMTLGH